MVPATDDDLVEGWFSMSFGRAAVLRVPRAGGHRLPAGSPRPAWWSGALARPMSRALAELDLVLPNHTHARRPSSRRLNLPTIEEVEAELAEDINNPKYTIWVAEHEGRVVSELVGVAVDVSSSWGPLMRPLSAGLLGYAATLPDARGLGAGRALTEAFFAWARDEGYEWLVTDWRSTNVEANRTWRAMGFRAMFDRLHRADSLGRASPVLGRDRPASAAATIDGCSASSSRATRSSTGAAASGRARGRRRCRQAAEGRAISRVSQSTSERRLPSMSIVFSIWIVCSWMCDDQRHWRKPIVTGSRTTGP